MPLPRYSFVLIDYVIRARDTNELVDTTVEEVAKKENKYDASKVYEPLLVIIGENRIVRGLEEHIENYGEPNKELSVELPPEKAYGPRDPSKVKVISLRELMKNGIVPEVGKAVEYGGQIGIVKAITGGRVLLDFNHPLAGKTLLCTYRIIKVVEDDAEKVRHLLHRRYKRVPVEKFNVTANPEGNAITIEVPPELLLDRELQLVKAIVSEEIFKYVGKYDTVIFIDKYTKGLKNT